MGRRVRRDETRKKKSASSSGEDVCFGELAPARDSDPRKEARDPLAQHLACRSLRFAMRSKGAQAAWIGETVDALTSLRWIDWGPCHGKATTTCPTLDYIVSPVLLNFGKQGVAKNNG